MQLLVSIPVAAHRLSIGKTLTYELLKLQKLQAVRLGGRTLIPVAELERFVAALPRRGGAANTAAITETAKICKDIEGVSR
jgi:excisionase family DNA binding protein